MDNSQTSGQRPEIKRAGELMERWRNLAEQRLAHMVELYQSGRWQRYYSESEFLRLTRELVAAIEAWKQLVPSQTPDAALRQGTLDAWKDLGGGDISLAPVWQGEGTAKAPALADVAPIVPGMPGQAEVASEAGLVPQAGASLAPAINAERLPPISPLA